MRLSIAQVISTGGLYGAERVLLELATYLQDEGYECRVAIIESPGAAKLFSEARARALPAVIVPCEWAFDRRSIRLLRQYLTDNNVNIAHSHGYKSDIWLRFAAPRHILKVATTHAWYRDTAKLRFYESADKFCLRNFAHVVAVSPALLENVRQSGVGAAKSSMIANGLALPLLSSLTAGTLLRSEWGLAPETKIVVRVGRLDSVKGNNLLLSAWREVVPRHNAHLVFVGEGEDLGALREQARQLGLTPYVTFAGFRDDVADILHNAALFVSPSLSEGLPMVLLEAMAARAPVVTTNVGAIGTVIRHGENGWLIPPNDVNALAQALNEALAAPEQGRAYAEQAWQDYAANYSREAMGGKYFSLYRNLLEEAAPMPANLR
jgi:glycosyltransferase involved in cell wall biosynthesis